jgi:uncharacterized protein
MADELDPVERRRRAWLIAGIVVAVTAALVIVLSGPPPPRTITFATGQPGGMYARHGDAYAARLDRIGLQITLMPTAGSIDNLRRLLSGEADVAFVQGGTYALVDDPRGKIRGIAALYYEPLWIFHDGGSGLRSLGELAGRKMSIGLPASGTEVVATALLRAHGIDPNTRNIERLPNPAARQRLAQGSLQAVFLVASYNDPLVVDLLAQPNLTLFSFHRDTAYTRKFPELRPVKLYEGTLDLRRNLPSHDVTLLAPAALLACRADLHPRVVEQLLKAAQAIHGPGTLLDPPLQFPGREGLDIPLHEAAEVYLTSGESVFSRNLPYGLLRWTLLIRVLVISLIIWVPLVRLLPTVARWRIDRRLSRLYVALRDADRRLASARDGAELKAALAELDRVCLQAEPLCDKIPAGRQQDVYNWRVHTAFVRSQAEARLAALESERAGIGAPRT